MVRDVCSHHHSTLSDVVVTFVQAFVGHNANCIKVMRLSCPVDGAGTGEWNALGFTSQCHSVAGGALGEATTVWHSLAVLHITHCSL